MVQDDRVLTDGVRLWSLITCCAAGATPEWAGTSESSISLLSLPLLSLRQGLTIQPWLSWKSLCRSNWLQTQEDPSPASASCVLGLKSLLRLEHRAEADEQVGLSGFLCVTPVPPAPRGTRADALADSVPAFASRCAKSGWGLHVHHAGV